MKMSMSKSADLAKPSTVSDLEKLAEPPSWRRSGLPGEPLRDTRASLVVDGKVLNDWLLFVAQER
jgi:hypothetical protein